jgi:O-antigen/teichoic acid export membrane protein
MSVLGAGANGVSGVASARALGASARGSVVLVVVTVGLTSVLISFGINVAIRYYLPRPLLGVTMGGYLGLSLLLTLLFAVVVAAIFLGSSYLILPELREPQVLGVSLAYAVFTFLAFLYLDAVNALGRLTGSAAAKAAGSVTLLAGTAICWLVLGATTTNILVAYTISGVVQVVACIGLMARHPGGERLAFSWRQARELLRRGIPALGLSCGQTVAFRADRYVLGLLANPAAVGVYSVAVTVCELMRLPAGAYGQLALHRAASGTATLAEIRQGTRRLVGLMVIPAVVLFAVAPWLVEALFGLEYRGAVVPLRVLLVAEIVLMAFHVNSRVLLGLGATKSAGLVGVVGAVLITILDFALIPSLAAVGAAVASVFAYGVMSGGASWQVGRSWDLHERDPQPLVPARQSG